MMIDFGEAEVFKRQMPQTLQGFVGRELTTANFLKELA